MVGMMWFKRESKPGTDKSVENGVVGKLRRKKAVLLKPTRESSERETSTESDKEKRRYSDILDMKVSLERRDESDESLYESADCHSDAISASDDALPRLSKTPTMSKESLKLAVTDEEVDVPLKTNSKKGHRKTMSLSNPLEMVRNLGDEWFETTKKELDKNFEKKKSRESLWSEEDKDSIHGSTMKLDQIRKNSKKEDKSQANSRKSSTTENPKSRKSSKGSSVSALNFLRRRKTPTSSMKAVESVAEVADKVIDTDEILNYTKIFLEHEILHTAKCEYKPPVESDTDDEPPTPTPKPTEHRRRLSRQTSRSKSKVRGKSQTVRVNTLRKSHSGTLKKGKKKSVKTPMASRSRQSSVVEAPPIVKKISDTGKQNHWLFSGSRGDSRREGSSEEQPAADGETDLDHVPKENDAKDSWRAASGRGVNRAESCREREPRDAPRRGKHRNASDPNRLTAHHAHDLEPGAPTAPSGSSSSSSLSSRSNESNTPAVEQHAASQSDWSEEDEPLAAQWVDSLPPDVLDSLSSSPRLRKRQEVIHELIVSEGSHVRWLKVLGREFLRPLERQPALLPSEELRALFPNLPAVRERHEKLYSELRAARAAPATAGANPHLVPVGHVADAMLNTLGEGGYATCLSRFCRGQRMALEALRERRRKHKELHHFLAAREQLPRCGRLQLRDLLACVWQRLTKYQLLLEGVLATLGGGARAEKAEGAEVAEGEASEDASAADVARLRRALATAKDVLHAVDTAIRAAENEHRLRTIQNKLEVRASGPEWEELRRLELPSRALRIEGDLSIRVDANKKIGVLALLLEDSLVLLQREGDRFVLKPITSQQGALSPLVKWDKVLFRPNAAVRNTFFLMNINGVQMHELSANTAAEYATWVKCIQESPLAKLTELKPSITPSHQASRSTDDSGINVSRNPSDASEKSDKSSSVALRDEPEESERDRERERERDSRSLERSSAERDRDGIRSETDVTERDRDDNCASVVARPVVARQSRAAAEGEEGEEGSEGSEGPGAARGPLEARAALTVRDPPAERLLAATALTHQERLRRLDAVIGRALSAKARVVCSALAVPPAAYRHMAELAVADTLGLVDVSGDMRATRLERSSSSEDESSGPDDIHQLLLAAHAQVSQLTALVNKALTVNEAAVVAARARPRPPPPRANAPAPAPAYAPAPADRCDRCADSLAAQDEMEEPMDDIDDALPAELEAEIERVERASETGHRPGGEYEHSFDMLAELDALPDDFSFESEGGVGGGSAAALAARAAGPCAALGAAVGRLAAALPPWAAAARRARCELAAHRDRADGERARRARRLHEYQMTEEISFPNESVDQIQDQPSNGG